jgi:hypothetical protein
MSLQNLLTRPEIDIFYQRILDQIQLYQNNIPKLRREIFIMRLEYSISHPLSQLQIKRYDTIYKVRIILMGVELCFAESKYVINNIIRGEIYSINLRKKKLLMNEMNMYDEALVNSTFDKIKIEMLEIIKYLNIDLSKDIEDELKDTRAERIFSILVVEEQLEDEVSPNVKQVIQNRDLNRYLMGFIN